MAKIKIVGNITTTPKNDLKLMNILEDLRAHKETMFFPSIIEDRSRSISEKRYQVNIFSEIDRDSEKEILHIQNILDTLKNQIPLYNVCLSIVTDSEEKVTVFTKEGRKEFLKKATWR